MEMFYFILDLFNDAVHLLRLHSIACLSLSFTFFKRERKTKRQKEEEEEKENKRNGGVDSRVI